MANSASFAIGIDIGTSGCRAVAVDRSGRTLANARRTLPRPLTRPGGCVEQEPDLWWEAVIAVLSQVAADLPGQSPGWICVDGTSATLLLCDSLGRPLGPALMYNDRRAVDAAALVNRVAPRDSPALGAGASLAKLIHLAATLMPAGYDSGDIWALHQADWVAGRLAGRFGWSDWNNSLKLGYEPQDQTWPAWVRSLVPQGLHLPLVLAPGSPIGELDPRLAKGLGFSPGVQVLAGTTDSTAAFIASGACRLGDAVTCLGSTLVLKVLASRPVHSAPHGVYSHRYGDLWLVGGASNSGGAVLRHFFSDEQLRVLSGTMDPTQPSGLDYYPLPDIGERFPRQDPRLAPRIAPIPEDRGLLLKGLFEGMARIEAEGYELLARLGAPRPQRILTTGGGAGNAAWTAIRRRVVGLPIRPAGHGESAYGSALLALGGAGPRMAPSAPELFE